MKKFLLISTSLFIVYLSFGQQKISGTVTYFYNDYQGNKADVGSSIYILKADSTIDFNAIDSVIKGEFYYSRLQEYKNLEAKSRASMKGLLLSKKKQEQLATKIPDHVINDAKNYGVSTEEGFDSLNNNAFPQLIKFKAASNKYQTKADGVGNYNINIKLSGDYYVMIISANRTGLGLCSALGQIYLEKVSLKEGDEKNVSNNFTLF